MTLTTELLQCEDLRQGEGEAVGETELGHGDGVLMVLVTYGRVGGVV